MTAHAGAMAAAADRAQTQDIEAVFTTHYARIARVIARLVGDRGRAEELAVEVFVKWWQRRDVPPGAVVGWLVRVAVRQGLDELRREARRVKFGRLWAAFQPPPPPPADVHASSDEQQGVRDVLGRMRRRDASLLLMRAEGLSYEDVAAALRVNPASVGTLVRRAQRVFRKEYLRRHGSAH